MVYRAACRALAFAVVLAWAGAVSTDVFVEDGGRWLFLAWTGGDDPKK